MKKMFWHICIKMTEKALGKAERSKNKRKRFMFIVKALHWHRRAVRFELEPRYSNVLTRLFDLCITLKD